MLTAKRSDQYQRRKIPVEQKPVENPEEFPPIRRSAFQEVRHVSNRAASKQLNWGLPRDVSEVRGFLRP